LIFPVSNGLFANYKVRVSTALQNFFLALVLEREIHMPTVGIYVDISTLVDATVAGDSNQIIATGRELLQRGAAAAELLGRVGMIAAHGDSDGYAILTLDAAAALSRWVPTPPVAAL